MNINNKKKIAYIAPVWPAEDENAILNQIVELRKRNLYDFYFFTFGTNIKENNEVPLEYIDYSLLNNIVYLKQPQLNIKFNKVYTKLSLFYKTIPLLFRTFFYSPIIFFKSLFKKEYGEYKDAFKIIYLIQPLLGKKYCFDIIHCHYAPYGIWGAILKDLGFIEGNMVTTFHGYGINKLPKQKPINFYDFMISKSSFFISNSNFTKNNAVKIGFPEDKIHVIRIALDIDKYKYVERKFSKNEVFNVFTVAALRNVKGLEYSIKAIRIILDDNPNIKLSYKIAGDGYLKEYLQNIISENKLEDYVELLGFVQHTELKSIYNESHLFILPSIITKSGNQEAQGLVLQESQASGLPVIGTKTGGIAEGIIDGRTGFVISQKNSHAIAEKIMFFYTNPEKIIEFGKAGRDYVKDKFNATLESEKLVNLYKQYN